MLRLIIHHTTFGKRHITMINWPAIIKYSGDDELAFVSSQKEWDEDPDLHFFYEPDDCLIDSEGATYHLKNRENNHVTPETTGKTVSLDLLNTLIQKHASQLGNSCVAKIACESISDAITAVKIMVD